MDVSGNIPELRTVVGILEELQDEGKISSESYDLYKDMYSKMHKYFSQFYANLKANQKRSKELSQLLLSKKIELERESIKKVESEQAFHELMKLKEKSKTELSECQERESALEYSVTEKTHDCKILQRKLQQMKRENENIMEPKVKALNTEIRALQQELETRNKSVEGEQQRSAELKQRLEALATKYAELEQEKSHKQVELNKMKGDPERIRKQGDIVDKAVKNLEVEIKNWEETIHGPNGFEEEIMRQARRKKAAEDAKRALNRKLEVHRTNIEQRERELGAVKKKLEEAQIQKAAYSTVRVEIELKEKAAEDSMRMKLDRLARVNKEFEMLKRKLKKKTKSCQAVANTIPNLEMQVTDYAHELDFARLENKKSVQKLKELKTEKDMLTVTFVNKSGMREEKKNSLNVMMSERNDLETELEKWRVEEANMAKMVAMLSAQREMKAREASKAMQNERETREEVKVKQLVILDLTKKVHEINNRLKEFSALYDVVKNERNKYVNLTQASSQAVAEMKEKIKILQNEVEILRNENLVKDRALHKERVVHQQACNQRDQLRLETNKCTAIYREKQEQVEQQIVEIDKLNSIINSMETEMLKLKKQYELAVETRNYTGIQLIDRNDELCILYEKSNIQEQTLKSGEMTMQEKEQEIRMLKLELSELNRQVEVTQRSMPLVPELRDDKIPQLQRELADEREITAKLCKDLETPKNQGRWRLLEGIDPDVDQLGAKAQVLEERLNDKKEQLLEKELVLEEVSALSNKLRAQASEGRDDTLVLAKKVNEFQAKIKDTTRKMMATVSELSMYQATAIKLQQEKEERNGELEQAMMRMDQGLPPTDDAEADWYRMQRDSQQRRMEQMARMQANAGVSGGMQMQMQTTHTTAEPRPNAYIPDGDLGIPKPYGALAPFKPTIPGSSMRHVRKPRPRDIEI